MASEKYLGVLDYIVISCMLLVSTVIGIKYRRKKDSANTTKDYLMAGKNMPLFPVTASAVVTMISATTMIGTSAETYKYGMQITLLCISASLGIFLAAHIFIPVYFSCGVSTVYEFLELRYGKTTRYAVSLLFIIQMVFFMSTVLYAPVLATSAFSDLSIEASIIIIGMICSFYCCMGGLKAVLWTDAFQAILMFICLLVPIVVGVREAGGIGKVLIKSIEGQRLNVNFHEDFTSRYTFWSMLLRGTLGGLTYYGTSQVEVQRVLTLRNVSRAKCSLYWTIPPSIILYTMCASLGIIFYSVFNDCDPITNRSFTGLTSYDQLMPYYIVSRLRSIPGLTGLCVAGIFSGSLSSLSSALNSLSTVTVMDFIMPLFPSANLSETKTVYIAKALTLLYGVICIAFTFLIARADSLSSVAHTLLSIMEGPMLAIYLIGVLTTKVNEKCALFGLLVGVMISSWLGYGNIFSGKQHPTLHMDSSGCLANLNATSHLFKNTTECSYIDNCLSSTSSVFENDSKPFVLYRLAFMWISPVGCVITIFFIFCAVCFTRGWSHDAIPEDSACLSPITRLWMKKLPKKRQGECLNSTAAEEMNTLTSNNGIDMSLLK